MHAWLGPAVTHSLEHREVFFWGTIPSNLDNSTSTGSSYNRERFKVFQRKIVEICRICQYKGYWVNLCCWHVIRKVIWRNLEILRNICLFVSALLAVSVLYVEKKIKIKYILCNISRFLTSRFRQIAFLMTYQQHWSQQRNKPFYDERMNHFLNIFSFLTRYRKHYLAQNGH